MLKEVQERVNSLLERIENLLSSSHDKSENIESIYHLNKKLQSISIHKEANVSSFDEENGLPGDLSGLSLTSGNEIKVGSKHMKINEFLNVVEKELEDNSMLDDAHSGENKEISRRKLRKMQLILKSYLEEQANDTLSSCCSTNSNKSQNFPLPAIVNTFFKETFGEDKKVYQKFQFEMINDEKSATNKGITTSLFKGSISPNCKKFNSESIPPKTPTFSRNVSNFSFESSSSSESGESSEEESSCNNNKGLKGGNNF